MANTKLKPTHRFRSTKEPCTYFRIKILIEKKHILEMIADTACMHFSWDGKTHAFDPEKAKKWPISRKIIEDDLRREFRNCGERWYEKKENDGELYHKKSEYSEYVMGYAKRLFPDWFADNSMRAILDLSKKEKS